MASRNQHPTAAVPSNLTVEEARAEIQKALTTLESVRDRMKFVAGALRTPADPIRDALDKAGFIPHEATTLIRDELEMFLEESDGIGSAIQYMQDSLSWFTHKKRRGLFIEGYRGDPEKVLNIAEAIELAETEGKYREARVHLGLALEKIDPDQDRETFFSVLFYIARFDSLARQRYLKDWSFNPTFPRQTREWFLEIHTDSAASDLESLRSLLTALGGFKGCKGYARLQRLERSLTEELESLKEGSSVAVLEDTESVPQGEVTV